MLKTISFATLGLILFLLSIFCLYGFLHSAEPGTAIGWRIGYGLVMLILFTFGSFCLYKALKR
tara:strand:+ start:277 stop:465 length:189 start_codon:yes stop_codon:yes gene_type:complete